MRNRPQFVAEGGKSTKLKNYLYNEGKWTFTYNYIYLYFIITFGVTSHM